MTLQTESSTMHMLRQLGLEGLAWSLRRFHCPVGKEALVLEVGSGGNPYYRANVLLDAYETTRERHWAPLVADRPTVLGLVEELPFKDKSFDFVIASHVLEHTAYPERFLAELQRVARAGYIEVPDAFMERINPYLDHRLEITVRDGQLVIRKKPDWRSDQELVELYEHRAKHWVTRELIPRHPFDFHVRYYWSDRLDYRVLNPEVDASWPAPVANRPQLQGGSGWRDLLRNLSRRLLSQNGRNHLLDWQSLLRCPRCHSESLEQRPDALACSGCGRVYPLRDGVPRMFPA